MITKKIPKSSEHPDNFNRLARYIAAAEEPGEKLHDFWIGNTAGLEKLEDLEYALLDIEAVRKMKPEANDKTYHFIVSLRPGEEEHLSGENLRDIAKRFVDELGFGEHQYVAGAHQNTDNFHLHVAVNRVHPETFKIKAPVRDFKTLARVSRELERELGLSHDRGMTDDDWLPGKSGHKAQDFERHTWRQSFQSYLIENKPDILAALDKAKTWRQVHRALEVGWTIELKPRGNGLVFANLDDPKQSMKASAFDRSCAKKALEVRLGPYQARDTEKGRKKESRARSAANAAKGKRYRAKPLLSRHPSIGPLWRRFLNVRKSAHKRSTMLGRMAGNWKLWLMTEAYEDPLAMVVLVAYQEALRGVLGSPDRQRRVPKDIEPQLAAWAAKGQWRKVSARMTTNSASEPTGLVGREGREVRLVRDDELQIAELLLFDRNGKAIVIGPENLNLTKARNIQR
ncbi:MAG: TraI/MobA(P) family conjugative relaxase [Rhodospirillales bacterium]